MPDLTWLAHLGRASVDLLWLPVLAWSAVALLAEAALRLGRTREALALPVRGAVLAALPLAVLVPVGLAAVAPQAALAVAAFIPDVVWLPEVAVGGPAPSVAASGPAVLDLGLGLLVLGGAAVGAYRVVEWLHAIRAAGQVRRACPPSGPAGRAAVDAARQRLGVRRAIAVAEAPVGTAPFTIGWRRPMVALPADLGDDAREVAAVHEVAHVRRGDFAWHAAQRAISAVFGAHPLVWTLGRGLDLDRERAADAVVLDACPDKHRAYADLLFSYAVLPAPTLALGAARGSSSLKTRLDAMTRPLSPTRARRLAWLGRAAGLAVGALVVAGAAFVSPPSASASESAPSDSLVQHIDRVDVQRDAGTSTVRVVLKPGADRSTAQRIVDQLTDGRSGTRLVVEYAGGAVEGRGMIMDRFRSDTRGSRTVRDTTDVYEIVEEMPELIGGLEGLQQRLEYPELQYRAGVQGTAVLQFVVSEAGEVQNLTVARSAGNDGLDRAAMAAVQDARFRPGREGGQAVRVRFAVPITFQIGDAPPRPERRAPAGEARPGEPEIFEVADVQPELIGGLAGLQERLVYPALARRAGIEGQVVVQFVVNEEGRVEDATVLRTPDAMLSEAALAAVRGSTFRPGSDGGRPVKVRFAVPIMFRLPASDGVDRGERRDARRVRGEVRYAGVDVSRLTPGSRQAFESTMRGLPEILGTRGAETGDVEVRYTVGSDGRNGGAAYVAGDRSLMPLAAGLVGALETAENARPGPGGSWTGTFRLWYIAEG